MTVAANKHPHIASVMNQNQLSKPKQKQETSQVIIVNESELFNNEVEADVEEHLKKNRLIYSPQIPHRFRLLGRCANRFNYCDRGDRSWKKPIHSGCRIQISKRWANMAHHD